MLKKWLERISPFVILSVITGLLLTSQLLFVSGPGEWKTQSSLKIAGLLLLLIGLDVVLKVILKRNLWLWILELFLCLVLFYYWIVT
jgi:hypothetical protein